MQELNNEQVVKDTLEVIVSDMCEAREIDEDKIPYLLRELAREIELEQSKYVRITNIPEDD